VGHAVGLDRRAVPRVGRRRDALPVRLPFGVGVFLASTVGVVPEEYGKHVLRSGSLPRTILFLTIVFDNVPFIDDEARCEIVHHDKDNDITWVTMRFGFSETKLDVCEILLSNEILGLLRRVGPTARIFANSSDREDVEQSIQEHMTFYIGKLSVKMQHQDSRLHYFLWIIFRWLLGISVPTVSQLQIPPELTVEIGASVDL